MSNGATILTQREVALLKSTYAKGATDDELNLFLTVAARRGLDPFSGQICFVKRRAQVDGEWKQVGTFQVTIDGYRSMADRTGLYAPGDPPTFDYGDKDSMLESATAEVLKWHDLSKTWLHIKATARYDEYVQLKADGTPTHMWAKMPHAMLAKCAEALAIRKGYPQITEGLDLADDSDGDLPHVTAMAVITPAAAPLPVAAPAPNGNSKASITQKPAASRGERLTAIEARRKELSWGGTYLTQYIKEHYQRASVTALTDDELATLAEDIAAAKPEEIANG